MMSRVTTPGGLQRLSFPVQVVQTDNGTEFQSAFHYHVLDTGVGHVYIKPRTPQLNGKVERSHRIDAEEFYRLLDGTVIDDAKTFNDKFREWEDYYNYHRPHGALAGHTPILGLAAQPVRRRRFPAHAVLPKGSPTRLSAIHGGLDHVFCATDLQSGEQVVRSKRGWQPHLSATHPPAPAQTASALPARARATPRQSRTQGHEAAHQPSPLREPTAGRGRCALPIPRE
jgi:Integrase core domain